MVRRAVQIGMFTFVLFSFKHVAFTAEPAICGNFFEATCGGKSAIETQNKYENMLAKVENNYVAALEQGLQTYGLKELLKKVDQPTPPSCAANPTQKNCVLALSKMFRELAREVQNHVLNKPSRFKNPNVNRPEILFELYEGISMEVAREMMAQNKDALMRANKIFGELKKTMIAKIENEIPDPQKTAMVKRLEAVRFDTKMCIADGMPSVGAMSYSAFYQPEINNLTICPRLLLSATTDTQLTFVLGHELAHSIDPCFIGVPVGYATNNQQTPVIDYSPSQTMNYSERLKQFPYASVIQCLRDKKSAFSKTAVFKPANPAGSYLSFFEQACAKDQIGESFSDWMAIESAAPLLEQSQKEKSPDELQKEYAAVFSTKCKDIQPGFDPHPNVERRTNGVLGINPFVRRILKCESPDTKNIYCKSPPPLTSANKGSEKVPAQGQKGMN